MADFDEDNAGQEERIDWLKYNESLWFKNAMMFTFLIILGIEALKLSFQRTEKRKTKKLLRLDWSKL
jgi:hypothetical protein